MPFSITLKKPFNILKEERKKLINLSTSFTMCQYEEYLRRFLKILH